MKEIYSHEEYIARNKRQGKGRWRLPTIEELLSIVDYTKHNPASNINITSNTYWSSTTYASLSDCDGAWGVGFYGGNSDYYYKIGSYYVCCVRDTQDGFEWGEDAPTRMTWDEAMEYAEYLNV